MHKALYLLAIGYLGVCAAIVWTSYPPPYVRGTLAPVFVSGSSGQAWFVAVRPYCNSVEVVIAQRNRPAPIGGEGQSYSAACYALGGRIDSARAVIDRLPLNERYQAAAIVFDAGHPVADAGDDLSAGPIMELVVHYMPRHYMALYHAGMAEYATGKPEMARTNLKAFLSYYHQDDGWTRNAREVLARLGE